jgi:hypothetical protein
MEEAIKLEETEAKGVDAITIRPLLHRLSISINDEPHNLSMLPTVRSDNEDKEPLIGCRPAKILNGLTEQEIGKKLS